MTAMIETSLPDRNRPRPPTNKNMPHTQIGVRPVPEVAEELFKRCFSLPDVRNEPTVISIPGARALWLDENIPLAHPEVIARGREFAHIHPDGSLHAGLPPDRAREAVEAGWAEPHPIAQYMGWDGMVMLYTPLDMDEHIDAYGRVRFDIGDVSVQASYSYFSFSGDMAMGLEFNGLEIGRLPYLQGRVDKITNQAQHTLEFFHNRIIYGAEYIYNMYESTILVEPERDEHRFGFFLQDEVDLQAVLKDLLDANPPPLTLTATTSQMSYSWISVCRA